jgi:hypothetical protein
MKKMIKMPYRIPPFTIGKAEEYHHMDFLTETGAWKLARVVEDAWRKAGHDNVFAYVEPISASRVRKGDRLNYAIKTNLVNGLPPR